MTNETRYPDLTIENIANVAQNCEPNWDGIEYDPELGIDLNMGYTVSVFVTESGKVFRYGNEADEDGEDFAYGVDAITVLEELGNPAPRMEDYGYDKDSEDCYFYQDQLGVSKHWGWDWEGWSEAMGAYGQDLYNYESLEYEWYHDACEDMLRQAQEWLKNIDDEGE